MLTSQSVENCDLYQETYPLSNPGVNAFFSLNSNRLTRLCPSCRNHTEKDLYAKVMKNHRTKNICLLEQKPKENFGCSGFPQQEELGLKLKLAILIKLKKMYEIMNTHM